MQAALQGGLHDAFLGTNNSAKTAPRPRRKPHFIAVNWKRGLAAE